MTTNDQLERIEAAPLAAVTGGAGGGAGDWIAKAKERVTRAVREGVDFVRRHPELAGTGRPLPMPRR